MNEQSPKSETQESQSVREKSKKPFRQRLSGYVNEHPARFVAGFVILAVLLFSGFVLWRYFESYESTDDAQVDGHINALSTRVNGTVIAVYVENNQFVKRGQKLVDLDPRDYRVAVEQARAALSQAQAEISAQNPNVPITQTTTATTLATSQSDIRSAEASLSAAQRDRESALAELRQAEAANTEAQAEVARYKKLVEKDEISREMWDQKVAAGRASAALVEARRAKSEAASKIVVERQNALLEARKRLSEVQQNAPHQISIQQAAVESRQANAEALKGRLDEALLQLSYCTIEAPVSGIIGNRGVEVGQRVQAGAQLMMITQVNDLWVTANFKETEIKGMRPGQRATIHVDALEMDFEGVVESLPGASGAVYSLLPPENATGNYVKVVQRLPVRIRFNQGQPGMERLRPGMSVEPKVWLKG